MRIFGALLIITASLSLCFKFTCRKRKRIDTISDLCTALDIMEGELEARLTPLPEIFKLISKRFRGPAGSFFTQLFLESSALGEQEFSLLWRQSAENNLTLLERGELEEIINLSAVLGRFELTEQLRAIKHCRDSLHAALENARLIYPEQKKLSLGLGTAGALLLVLGLI